MSDDPGVGYPRAAAVAALLLATGCVLVATPLLALAALVASPFCGRLRPLRILWLADFYLLHDCAAVAACAGLWLRYRPGGRLGSEASREAHYRLARWFLGRLHHEAVAVLRLTVDYEASGAAVSVLADATRPVIVLARHGGVADSFLLAHELLSRFDRRPRIVMHARLSLDPAIGLLGRRLPMLFVPGPRSGTDTRQRIAELAGSMGPGDALLIFPEGGNYTRARRQRALTAIYRRDRRRGRRVERLRNVMPVHPDGSVSALGRCRSASAVIVGHHGLGEVERAGAVWRRLPVADRAVIRMWAAAPADVPVDDAELVAWLDERWLEVDRWIDRSRIRAAVSA